MCLNCFQFYCYNRQFKYKKVSVLTDETGDNKNMEDKAGRHFTIWL